MNGLRCIVRVLSSAASDALTVPSIECQRLKSNEFWLENQEKLARACRMRSADPSLPLKSNQSRKKVIKLYD